MARIQISQRKDEEKVEENRKLYLYDGGAKRGG